MNTDADKELMARASAALDQQAQAQGEEIHQRLAMARRAAIAEMERVVPHALSPWIPAAAVATTILTVGLLSLQLGPPELPVYGGETDQLAAQNMELLSEMDFVAWMIEADELDAG